MENLASRYSEYRVVENPHPDLVVTGLKLRSLARRHFLLQRRYQKGFLDERDFMKSLRNLIGRRDKEIFKAAELVADTVGGFGLCAAEDIIKTVEDGSSIRTTQVQAFLKNTGLTDYFARRN